MRIFLQITILAAIFLGLCYLNVVFASNFSLNMLCSGVAAFLLFQIPFINEKWIKITLSVLFILATYFISDVNILWLKDINIIIFIFLMDISKKWWPKIALVVLVILFDFVYYPYASTKWSSNAQIRNVQTIFTDCYLVDRNQDSIQLEKGKVYLLNFSFVGCLPCRNKHPQIEKLQQLYKNHKQIRVLTIHSEQDFEVFKKLAKDQYHDAGLKFKKRLKVWGFPMEYIIDKKGKVRRRYESYDKSQSWAYQLKTRELLEELAGEND